MGWASGRSLLEDVARIVMPHIPKAKRPKVAKKLIKAFESEDCDTINEVEQVDIRQEYDRQNPPDPWEEGCYAAAEGINPEKNPYPSKSKKHKEWENGYASYHTDT